MDAETDSVGDEVYADEGIATRVMRSMKRMARTYLNYFVRFFCSRSVSI